MSTDESERKDPAYWFALLRAPLTSSSLSRLLHLFGSPAAIFGAGASALRRAGLTGDALTYFRRPDWGSVEQDLRWLEQPGNHLLSLADEAFPGLLKDTADPPVALLVRGDPATLGLPQIAIVGSRNATPGGKRIARSFAFDLGALGITITSGLATGIDSHAHRGALDAGARTIAVFGNGPDTIYPNDNRELAEAVAATGALVTEFPTGMPPLPENFPRRNRIISGLCMGTLVVEAAERSGSLITARLALEQGREVFAVPGSIRNPAARGCHALLRQGATLVEKAEDILSEIPHLLGLLSDRSTGGNLNTGPITGLDGREKLLLDNIGDAPVHIDSLIEYTDLPAGVAASALSSLEIAGLVESLPGGHFIRK